jgi:hypothetical protein
MWRSRAIGKFLGEGACTQKARRGNEDMSKGLINQTPRKKQQKHPPGFDFSHSVSKSPGFFIFPSSSFPFLRNGAVHQTVQTVDNCPRRATRLLRCAVKIKLRRIIFLAP